MMRVMAQRSFDEGFAQLLEGICNVLAIVLSLTSQYLKAVRLTAGVVSPWYWVSRSPARWLQAEPNANQMSETPDEYQAFPLFSCPLRILYRCGGRPAYDLLA
jgi:hypothetical protein